MVERLVGDGKYPVTEVHHLSPMIPAKRVACPVNSSRYLDEDPESVTIAFRRVRMTFRDDGGGRVFILRSL